KVSMRLSGFTSQEDIDLRVLLKSILEKTGGYGGGHRLAAGGTVPPDKEKLLIETALDVLGRAVVEQRVV
ncbi:MAG: DHH family phosphoesterase, partial [Nanoarchaeota archaeon]